MQPIFRLAIEDEIIVSNPIKRMHVPKRNQLSEKKIILDAKSKYPAIYKAINQLFNSTDTIVITETKSIECNINPHHLAIFLFGFHGRRLREVTSLQWEDIDLVNNQYKVRKELSKINQDMIFTLPQDVKEALLKFKCTHGNVFHVQHLNRYYEYIRLITGIEDFSFHWMRNLAVSALSGAGVPTSELSAMLGHQEVTTLNKYLSLQRETATKNTNYISAKLLGIK